MHHPFKVLIAYDGSPAADFALEDLRRAGLDARTAARVVCVVDSRVSLSEAYAANAEFLGMRHYGRALPDLGRAAGKAEKLAGEGAARLRGLFPQWKVDAKAVIDAPASGILAEAGAWKADLIVLGSRKRSGVERLLLGSISEKVLAQAHCAVRIASGRGLPGKGAPRILVATDGSRAAKAMVRRVAARAWPEATRFQVIAAMDYPLTQRKPTRQEQAIALRVAEQALGVLRRRGLQGSAVIGEGDARLEVPKAARKFRATGLFVGRRGLHGIRRWLLGGISSHLARHAPCPIEVIAS